ncbi:MAG: hypothetical protein SCALA702_00870 [Melioribacteraceae bacterium]|nr:MAG: hypothetical protein SCALA702_00870 [Melioribacteraceae bacterium]
MRALIFCLMIAYSVLGQPLEEQGIPCSNIVTEIFPVLHETLDLAVVLVEFSDIKHYGANPGDQEPYMRSDFENLLFSSNQYYSPNMYSPDEEEVFGSVRDYFFKMSDGNFQIEGSVINRELRNGEIDWITLNKTKDFYHETSRDIFFSDVMGAVSSAGYSIQYPTRTLIIYAGHAYRGGGLNPAMLGGRVAMSEMFAPGEPYAGLEHPDRKFSHIGIFAHEISHLLNLRDVYDLYSATLNKKLMRNNGNWDLMATGCYNGPNGYMNGACPAPINPVNRIELGWCSYQEIVGSFEEYELNYSMQDPEVFICKDGNNEENIIYFEFRNFNSNMSLGIGTCPDYNSCFPQISDESGILVWKSMATNPNYYPDEGNFDAGVFVRADNDSWASGYSDDSDILPGENNIPSITPWSDHRMPYDAPYYNIPNTRFSINDGLNTGIEVLECYAHYAIARIHDWFPAKCTPSSPKEVAVTESNGHPYIEWTFPSTRPYLHSFILERKDYLTWDQIAVLSPQTSSYLDDDVHVHPMFEDEVQYRVKTKALFPQNIEKISVPGKIVTIDNCVIKKISEIIEFALLDNYPNPFNPSTAIEFSIPSSSYVSLKIYNIAGEEVDTLVNEILDNGSYSVEFNANNLSSGIYFYHFVAGEFSNVKKMVLMK